MTAEDILTELYENFQDGKYWDKALKKIKEYVNQKVIEELDIVSEYASLDDKELMNYIDKRKKELKQ